MDAPYSYVPLDVFGVHFKHKRPRSTSNKNSSPFATRTPSDARALIKTLTDSPWLTPQERLDKLCEILGDPQETPSIDGAVLQLQKIGLCAKDNKNKLAENRSFQSNLSKAPSEVSAGLPGFEYHWDNESQHEDWALLVVTDSAMALCAEDLDVIPILDNKSVAISTELIKEIYCSLPMRCKCVEEWMLLYSTIRDGESFVSFIDKCNRVPLVLIVIKTTKGEVFGAFLAEALTLQHGSRFYGSRESFVFSGNGSESFRCYPWSRENDFFVMSMDHTLAIGGGGNFAIHFDKTLETGTTGPCSTFQNPALVSGGDSLDRNADFQVSAIEVWSVGGNRPPPEVRASEDEDIGIARPFANGGGFWQTASGDRPYGRTSPIQVAHIMGVDSLGRSPTTPVSNEAPSPLPIALGTTPELGLSASYGHPRRPVPQRHSYAEPLSPNEANSHGGFGQLNAGGCMPRNNSLRSIVSIGHCSITSSIRGKLQAGRYYPLQRPPAPLDTVSFMLSLDPTRPSSRAAHLLASIARSNDYVHLYTTANFLKLMQRAANLFANMEEFHLSWEYDHQNAGSRKLGITNYASAHLIDILVCDRIPRSVFGSQMALSVPLDLDLLYWSRERPSTALWFVHPRSPLCAYPPSYLLCVDDTRSVLPAAALLSKLITPNSSVTIVGMFRGRTDYEVILHEDAMWLQTNQGKQVDKSAKAKCMWYVKEAKLHIEQATDDMVKIEVGVASSRNPPSAVLDYARYNKMPTLVCMSSGLSRMEALSRYSLATYALEHAEEHSVLVVSG